MVNEKHIKCFSVDALLLIVCVVLSQVACSQDPLTPAAQIRQVILAAQQASEQKEIGFWQDLISNNYKDANGYEKGEIIQVIRYHFLRQQKIYLMSRIKQIEPNGADQFSAVVLVAMAAKPIENVQSLTGLQANLHRFEVVFQRRSEGRWQVLNAHWREAALREFF